MTGEQNETLSDAGPKAPARRIQSLDAIRGLALFGVLIINLDSEFRLSLFEQFQAVDPASTSTWLDHLIADFLTIFFESKAFAVFSLLFGVGLAMQFDRWPEPARVRLLTRRLLVLLLFGVLHLALIWNGDILTEYALAGLLLVPLMGRSRRALAIAAALAMLIYLAMPWIPMPFAFPSPGWIEAHVIAAHATYGGGSFMEILRFRLEELPQIAKLHVYVFPRTIALMLFGALIWRSGVLNPASGARTPAWATGASLVLLGTALSIRPIIATDLAPGWIGSVLSSAAPVLSALGYVALVLAVSSGRGRWLVDWAAPAGRMAFTNYIVQSVVLGLLFYGYGAGLMGQVGVAGGLGIAAAIFALQALASAWWLKWRLFGPLEWAWRSLTYGSFQPLRPGP